MNSFFVILFYIFSIIITMVIVTRQYAKKVKLGGSDPYKHKNRLHISIMGVFVIDGLFVLCNYIATRFKPVFTGDRLIYAWDFQGVRMTPSAGLDVIIGFLKNYTSNPEYLFYFSTFLTLLITLIAFNCSSDTTPLSILFLLSTQYIFNTFSVLKQSFTNAFAALCIVSFLEGHKNKKFYILGVISLLLSISFHHTGYFLIPICLIIIFRKTKVTVFVYSFAMILSFLFLDKISIYLAEVLSPILPVISTKLVQYVGENSLAIERLTFIKGTPYYVINILGFVYRRNFKDKIVNYDNYLLLSTMLSFCYLTTLYNGWLYRFAYFFFLPVGIFFALLMKNTKNRNNRIILSSCVIGMTAFLAFRFVVLMFVNYGGF